MENKSCNTSIKCTVSSCAYNSHPYSCCTLDSIKVGCCASHPTQSANTECASFKLGTK